MSAKPETSRTPWGLVVLLGSMTALGHYGKPEDIAASVAFLASPAARQITGTTITVDGGANA